MPDKSNILIKISFTINIYERIHKYLHPPKEDIDITFLIDLNY